MNWYIQALKKYAVFSGRAHRREYWFFTLFNMIFSCVAFSIDYLAGLAGEMGYGPFGTLYGLAVLLPGIAVSVRRLHDTGRTGWWLLLSFVPFVGALVLLFFMVGDSQAGSNGYGPNPNEALSDAPDAGWSGVTR